MARVDVVDDDCDVQGVLREALDAGGHQVRTFSDGRAALAACRAESPDVVITDVLMPRASGIDLVHALVGLPKRPRLIVMSGVVGEAFLRAAVDELGVDRVFTKPFDVQEIVRAVDDLTRDARD
jgi:DNA-binding response OmpR family regulator